ncbi:hypothetical protein Tco_0657861 [Tanacetum coccineum]
MLKIGDYDLWSMRMEQYLTHIDYALWEVIMNGDAPAIASASIEGPIPPKTFHGINDAKSLWEAIKTRFGGNKESKKMQKTILKHQYEKFIASRSEGLDKIYDRFQKLISQLEIHDEKTLAALMKQFILLMKFLLLTHRDKLLPHPMLMISQMAGGHAYHESEEILNEDKKEFELQWQRNCWL